MDLSIYKVKIPAGKKGEAEITHFKVDQRDAARFNMSLVFSGHGHRSIAEGEYTRLTVGGQLMMTDTPAEILDHLWFIRKAEGDVLITGLGLGMVANAVAEKPDVTSVTVIEMSQDVIDLVGPTLHEKVTCICADAHEYRFPTGTKFDAVWNDVWPSISLDDAESRAKLNRRFFRICRTGVKGAWATEEFRREQSRDRRERSYIWW